MAASSVPQRVIKPPQFEFPDEMFKVSDSLLERGERPFTFMVYGLPGRGKSSFLKSVVDAWGSKSVIAIDAERRLDQLGVPRVYIPDFSAYPEEQHYGRIMGWWSKLIDLAELRGAPFNNESRFIAIDTFNTLYKMIFDADLARRQKDVPAEQRKYQFQWYTPLYDDILRQFRRMIRLADKGYSVAFLNHVINKSKNVNGEEIDSYEPVMPPALAATVNQLVHSILYIKASDTGGPNYFVTRPVGDSIPAKDQTGLLPPRLHTTWKAILAAQRGEDHTVYKPEGISFVVKKEGK